MEVTPLAACDTLSTTAPPLGSAESSVVARATSAGLPGLTEAAARPRVRNSASLGTPSVAGSSAMKMPFFGSKAAVKVSETSRAVMPGSRRWNRASL